jgi:hypothetical protein
MSPLESNLIVFLGYNGNQNHHTNDLVEHTGLSVRKAAYSRYDVTTKMFYTDNNNYN